MAYSDIQNKVSQIRMADQILLAQEMSDEEKYKKKKQLKKQTRRTPKQRRADKIKKDPTMQGGSPGTVFVPPEVELDPTAEEIQEALQDEDMRQGDYLEDPENPFNINTLLQIGGAAGSMIPFMGGNMLKMLIGGPNAMAMDFQDAMGGGGYVGTDVPEGLGGPVFINSGGEAYIYKGGQFRFDGMYDPARHGPVFPKAQANDDMKIAKLPHTPPTEKIVLPNGKLMDSPLRFKTDQERIKFMEDFSRGYGRYSQKNTPMNIAQVGAQGAHTNVDIHKHTDMEGKTTLKVLPKFGATYNGPIRLKKVE